MLDWWHVAVRFEHALRTARGLGAGRAGTRLANGAIHKLERAKWRLWHGRWAGCRRKLADLRRWTDRQHLRGVPGVGRLQRHVAELLSYLERNQDALVPYAARRRRGEPISTAFVESAVNEIVAKRMTKSRQMRWSWAAVQQRSTPTSTTAGGGRVGPDGRRVPPFWPGVAATDMTDRCIPETVPVIPARSGARHVRRPTSSWRRRSTSSP